MKIALFTSCGYSNNCIDYYLNNLIDKCDLFINYYGDNNEYFDTIKQCSKFATRIKTTKFPSLKQIYLNCNINTYDYVLVFDDDMILENGELINIPYFMQKYSIDIASPSHSIHGRISHKIMKNEAGNHIFRYTNFIEMNFPIFSRNALSKYMDIYDGKLCGWGNDWWYLNTLDSNNKKNCAIFDNVSVINPDHHIKNFMTIEKFMNRNDRHDQWKITRDKNHLEEWTMKNLEFIYE